VENVVTQAMALELPGINNLLNTTKNNNYCKRVALLQHKTRRSALADRPTPSRKAPPRPPPHWLLARSLPGRTASPRPACNLAAGAPGGAVAWPWRAAAGAAWFDTAEEGPGRGRRHWQGRAGGRRSTL
jgi:hypothetical protein